MYVKGSRCAALAAALVFLPVSAVCGAGPAARDTDWDYVEEFRIAPAQKRLKVGKAALFQVEHCSPILGERDARGERAVLGQECGPFNLGIAGMILSNWSVNGVSGGNAVYGTVHADVDRGGYEAPATLPDRPVVALSVDLKKLTDPNLKATLVAEITLVDSEFYFGFVKFAGRREENGEIVEYSGRADLEFQLAEIFAGGVRYDLVHDTVWNTVEFDRWTVRDDSRTCTLIGKSVAPAPKAVPGGTLFTYSASESYVFGALLFVSGKHRCVDGDSTTIEELELPLPLTTQTGLTMPAEPGFQALGDGKRLTGTSRLVKRPDEDDEGSLTQEIRWVMEKQ